MQDDEQDKTDIRKNRLWALWQGLNSPVAVIGVFTLIIFGADSLRDNVMEARFEAIYTKFDEIDVRFDQVDARFDQVDARFDRVEARTNARFDGVDQRLNQIETDLKELTGEVSELNSRMAAVETYISGTIASPDPGGAAIAPGLPEDPVAGL